MARTSAHPLTLHPVSRRALLAGMAGGVALLSLPGAAHGQRGPENPVFRHGVASGDPDQTSVVLWTRVTATGTVDVEWELAEDTGFARIVQSGKVATGPLADHTVKLLASGLEPGGVYYYRFRYGGVTSPEGRTRTLPDGKLDRLGIALASCSNYAFGLFNAYDAIARDADVEFVLHTGDYIYEYGADGWGAEVAQSLGRVHEPAHEIVTLADYRQRHAQYKTDPGSQAMHSAHPLMACWDDHESTNNPWTGGAQNHQPETEGDWPTRRNASIRAYFEWMPVREPEWLPVKGRRQMDFWREYRFGDLATLFTLETRHTARAEQIEYADWATRLETAEDVQKFEREQFGKPGRAMLSPALERDLDAALRRSVGAGEPWRLIGNPMPIARTRVPDVVGMGLMPDPLPRHQRDGALDLAAAMKDPAAVLAWKGARNLPFYPDTWDGYPWAREKLYALAESCGARDLLFLTGDSHSFWANRLADDSGRRAGIELGTAGISSPGDFMASGFGPDLSPRLDAAFADHNDEIVWTDNMHQGYVRVELRRTGGMASFVAVDTVLSPSYRTRTIHRFDIVRGKGSIDIDRAGHAAP